MGLRNTNTDTIVVNTFLTFPRTCMESAPTSEVTANCVRFTRNAPPQFAASRANVRRSLHTKANFSSITPGRSKTHDIGNSVSMENKLIHRKRLIESRPASLFSNSSCKQLFTPRATLDANTKHTPSAWNLGSPPAANMAPPITGTSVSQTLLRSCFPRIKTPPAAVNAGVDAARACSRLTSTYLNDATARATETARVCDSANTFPASLQFFKGTRLLHPTFALNSHHKNETSM
mmetsp:Transcript_12902/g.48247  ORF Transcript_12902/g.48247 Transcript_12902/m.48247 type:complete len:234 (-) Transcript_12902:203-904(-)